jgi:hypothetical protein
MTMLHRAPRLLIAALTAALVTGCSLPVVPIEPPTTDTPPPPGTADVDPLEAIDAGSAALRTQLDVVAVRVADIGLLFEAAGALDADDAGARAEIAVLGTRILTLLLGDPASDADGGPALVGLLPAIEVDRTSLGSDDLITRTVTLAGDVGGERSRLVLELVRDPMVGDLGAWQRDPLGVIALARAAVMTATDVATLDAALLELPGELTRALGYALVLTDRDEPALLVHAASSGAARMRVVLVALSLADETLATGGTP